jgi:hypothetical protein
MIQINKSRFQLQKLANDYYFTLDTQFNISKKVDEILDNKKIAQFERDLFNEFKKNLKKIIISTPSELVGYETRINSLYKVYLSKKTHGLKGSQRKNALKKAKEKIFQVFDYNQFTKKNDGKFAYDFTENLDVNVCLYCNRQYTFTLYTTEGKCRPTLDHFLDKATYPYFALSFYNLIPSCYTCNSSLKNQRKFVYGENLHPFNESMMDVMNFGIDIRGIDFINGVEKDFNITFKPSTSCTDAELIERCRRNAEVFKIEELYQGHKDYASQIIKRAYFYDESKINELYNFETPKKNKLFDSKVEAIEFALGNYLTEKGLGKRPLAKFTKDIIADLDFNKISIIK